MKKQAVDTFGNGGRSKVPKKLLTIKELQA